MLSYAEEAKTSRYLSVYGELTDGKGAGNVTCHWLAVSRIKRTCHILCNNRNGIGYSLVGVVFIRT